jgi:hypothetical protein
METLLLMLPGFVFLQLLKNQKSKSTPNHYEDTFPLKGADGWQIVLQASALSLIFLVAPSVVFKIIGIILSLFYDLDPFRTKVHKVFGERYALTYIAGIALAVSPVYSQWLSNKIEFLTEHLIARRAVTPYETIIGKLVGSVAFAKTKSGNYIIGMMAIPGGSLKDDQISIYPHFVGSRRKLDEDEAATYNARKDAKYPAVDAKREYLVFDVAYPIQGRRMDESTLFFYKMADVEYVSKFHEDIHEHFIFSGETVELFPPPAPAATPVKQS